MEDILQDIVSIQVREYVGKYESYDHESNELAKKFELNIQDAVIDERQKLADEINRMLGTPPSNQSK